LQWYTHYPTETLSSMPMICQFVSPVFHLKHDDSKSVNTKISERNNKHM